VLEREANSSRQEWGGSAAFIGSRRERESRQGLMASVTKEFMGKEEETVGLEAPSIDEANGRTRGLRTSRRLALVRCSRAAGSARGRRGRALGRSRAVARGARIARLAQGRGSRSAWPRRQRRGAGCLAHGTTKERKSREMREMRGERERIEREKREERGREQGGGGGGCLAFASSERG
jgi:hypothetical protein